MDTGKDGYAALSTNDAGPGDSRDESKPPVRVVRKCGLLWYGVYTGGRQAVDYDGT